MYLYVGQFHNSILHNLRIILALDFKSDFPYAFPERSYTTCLSP